MTVKQYFDNAHAAILAGNNSAPCGVGYSPSKGWFVYDLLLGLQQHGATPEFLCVKLGRIPIPLSDEGAEILGAMFYYASK